MRGGKLLTIAQQQADPASIRLPSRSYLLKRSEGRIVTQLVSLRHGKMQALFLQGKSIRIANPAQENQFGGERSDARQLLGCTYHHSLRLVFHPNHDIGDLNHCSSKEEPLNRFPYGAKRYDRDG